MVPLTQIYAMAVYDLSITKHNELSNMLNNNSAKDINPLVSKGTKYEFFYKT